MDTPTNDNSTMPTTDNPCQQAALDYLQLNWSPIPLCPSDHAGCDAEHQATCKTPGKRPYFKWKPFQTERPTEAHLRQSWHRLNNANVGICLGPVSNLIGLDIDGPDGDLLLNDWRAGDIIPATLEFTTPGGGRRLLFKHPDQPIQIKSHQAGKKEAIRVLAEGSQTVAPPSRHANGAYYEWVPGRGPGEIEPAECPEWLMAQLTKKSGQEGAHHASPPDWPPIEQRIARAKAYLAKCDPAISGQGGHAQTILVANRIVKGFAIDPGTSLQVLIDDYNHRCQPPWSIQELEHKIQDAAKSFATPGYMLDHHTESTKFQSPNGKHHGQASSPPSQPKDATAADLFAAGKTLNWHCPGWFQAGVLNCIASQPGVGKTRYAADLARRIWFGLAWPDGSPPSFPLHTPCLWVPADHNHAELVDVLQKFGVPLETIYLNTDVNDLYGGLSLDTPEELAKFRARIKRIKPAMVFVDTSLNATEGAPHKAEDAKKFFTPIAAIATETDTAICMLTHLNADGKPLGRRIDGQCRVSQIMERPDPENQPNRRRLYVHKSNGKLPPELGITMGDQGNDYDAHPPLPPNAESTPSTGEKPQAKPGAAEKCAAWLVERLDGCQVRVKVLREEAAKLHFAPKTLYAAAESLEVIESQQDGKKWWQLPDD
jgi:hypothetical protein